MFSPKGTGNSRVNMSSEGEEAIFCKPGLIPVRQVSALWVLNHLVLESRSNIITDQIQGPCIKPCVKSSLGLTLLL